MPPSSAVFVGSASSGKFAGWMGTALAGMASEPGGLPLEFPFQLGLSLFCCMPTTLTSGVALTAQARGNVALALLLTVLTNTLGILTVPFVLAYLLASLGQVELSATALLIKLCFSIV